MSSPQPLAFPFSGTIDSHGNLSVNLTGFQAGVWGSWTLNLVATAGLASVLAGGSPVAGPIPIHNGGATLGPVLTYGSQGASVTITNGNPGEVVTGMAYGMSSDDPQDLSGMPAQGYSAVGQSTSFDGQNLITETSVTHGADSTYPFVSAASDPQTFDVRNYASVLLGLRLTSGGPLLITFRWYQNDNGTRLVGQKSMILDSVVSTAVATIPNLGPFLQVVVNRIIGGNFVWNASLVTSQRLVPDIFGGNFTPYLIEEYAQTLAPSGSQTFPFGTLYGGPVYYSFRNRSGSPGTVTFAIDQMASTDGTYKGIGLIQNVNLAAGGELQGIAVLPPVPCQARIVAGVTAGTYTYDVLVYTTTTGAS